MEIYLNVSKRELSDFAHSKPTASAQAEDHAIHAGVQGAMTFPGQVVQNATNFVALENF